jgi:isoleucyl-tRNA synthetase
LNETVTVALDTELTEALRREGAVRDVIRQIQTLRKEAGYAVEQRIRLAVLTPGSFLHAALEEAAEHVKAEVLADDLRRDAALAAPDMVRELKIAGEALTLHIAKS